MANLNKAEWDIYGSELSPFTLKLIVICDYAGLPFRLVPTDCNIWHGLKILGRRLQLINGRIPLTWPEVSAEDEFPLVPYLFGPAGENLYDSSAIAFWLDRNNKNSKQQLVPQDPAQAFVVRLIDDYADEFGLYMVHHQRWKVSATNNNAGQRLAHEFRRLIGPIQPIFAAWFSARQVTRLPYLFSVGPQGFCIPELPRRRQPPSLPDFPATHQLLEQRFNHLLQILESLLTRQAFILGNRFSLADAALYGQLSMNLDDPDTAGHIRQQAPTVFNWLNKIRRLEIKPDADSEWVLNDEIAELLHEICQTHIPLMQQNLSAYENWRKLGETQFNEAAFNNGKSLYTGRLCGQEYKHVAKSFQAKNWRLCHREWRALSPDDRNKLEVLLPVQHGLDTLGQPVELVR